MVRSKNFQFSLRTLVLIILLGGSVALLSQHWMPWRLHRSYPMPRSTTPRLSPDGRTMVIRTEDGSTHVFDIESGAEHILEHTDATNLTFLDRHRLLAVDRTAVLLFDLETGACRSRFSGEHFLDLSSDKKLFAIREASTEQPDSPDGESWAVKIYDTETESLRLTLPDIKTTSLRFSPDGNWLIGTGDTLQVWNTSTGRMALSHPMDKPTDLRERICVSNGDLLAIVEAHSVEIINLQDSKRTTQIHVDNPVLCGANCFSPDLKAIAITETDRIRVWETETGRQLSVYPGEASNNTFIGAAIPGVCAGFLPDGRLQKFTVTESMNATPMQSEPVPPSLPLQPGEAFSCYLGDERTSYSLALTVTGDDAFVWNVPTGARTAHLKNFAKLCRCDDIVVSPSAHRILAHDSGGFGVWLWSLDTLDGQCLVHEQYQDAGYEALFSNDERFAVIWSGDGSEVFLYRRCRPEGLAGICVLPEFWLAVMFALATVWNIRQFWKNR